jgi:hypothetical protein
MEITFGMMYLFKVGGRKYAPYFCTPAQLYTDIINLGYSWDTLLNTRQHWVFVKDDNDNLPFLSTLDLLKMRVGEYKPYWLNPAYIKASKGFLHETLSTIPLTQLQG